MEERKKKKKYLSSSPSRLLLRQNDALPLSPMLKVFNKKKCSWHDESAISSSTINLNPHLHSHLNSNSILPLSFFSKISNITNNILHPWSATTRSMSMSISILKKKSR
ncbi:hypothetical protein HMI55_003835 [Coelomomyces lativittatus]|nr:hypothetical protein HMI55_003835 [Coelomomyces lativittatus]